MTSGALDGDHNFLGDDSEYRDWFGVVGQSRDSAALERSNFRVALEREHPSSKRKVARQVFEHQPAQQLSVALVPR